MEAKDYIDLAVRTESPNAVSCNKGVSRLLHGAIGVCTEGGELLDALKKHIFYDKPLDEVNLEEEVGDLMWYCAIILNELGSDFESVMEQNIAKLRTRYPAKFSHKDATHRDIVQERETLEGHSNCRVEVSELKEADET